jgi:hypothetical protein
MWLGASRKNIDKDMPEWLLVNSSFDNLRLSINLCGRLIKYKHKIQSPA